MGNKIVELYEVIFAFTSRRSLRRMRAFSLFARFLSFAFGLRVPCVEPFPWWLDDRLLMCLDSKPRNHQKLNRNPCKMYICPRSSMDRTAPS